MLMLIYDFKRVSMDILEMISPQTLNTGIFHPEFHAVFKRLKAEKLLALTKYNQKNRVQGNFMTCFFDFATPYINLIQ